MTVSTASELIRVIQLDDAVVEAFAEPEHHKKQPSPLLRLPGFGVFGMGSALVGLLLLYKSSPAFAKEIQDLTDVFTGSGDPKFDEQVGSKGADIAKLGSQTTDTNDLPSEPRIASVQHIDLPAPKFDIEGHTPIAEPTLSLPEQPSTVSRGDQLVGSGAPLPKGAQLAKPSAEIDLALRKAAAQEHIDYATLYAVAGSESSFKANARAYGGTSTATGLMQFTAPTWKHLIRLYPDLGYTETDRTDPVKSAVMGARYLNSIKKELGKKIGHTPSVGETYLGYFMGVGGATKFLKAYTANPNAKGADVFPEAAKANPQLFYDKGNKNVPLTLAQTKDRLEGKVVRYYAQAQQSTPTAQVPPPVIDTAPKPHSVSAAALKATTAKPQPLPVQAPDFNAQGPKADQREIATKTSPKTQQQGAGNSVLPLPSAPDTTPVTYFKDKAGRIIAIRG